MNEKLKEQFSIIMSDFNFKEVHDVMIFLRWEWKYAESPEKAAAVPSIEELKLVATTCLERVMESEEETITETMGPFEAQKYQNTLELTFILQRVNPLNTLLNPGKNYELARKA